MDDMDEAGAANPKWSYRPFTVEGTPHRVNGFISLDD